MDFKPSARHFKFACGRSGANTDIAVSIYSHLFNAVGSKTNLISVNPEQAGIFIAGKSVAGKNSGTVRCLDNPSDFKIIGDRSSTVDN